MKSTSVSVITLKLVIVMITNGSVVCACVY